MIQTVTNLGLQALAGALSDETEITFTKCRIGTGDFDPDTMDAAEMEALISVAATANVSVVRKEIDGVTVCADMDNTLIAAGTVIREMGMFAKVGTGSEFLFAYAYAEEPETVPPPEQSTYERRFKSHFIMSNEAANLVVTYDSFEDAMTSYAYPKNQVYTKTEADALLATKADGSQTSTALLLLTTEAEYDRQVANNTYPGRNIAEIEALASELSEFDTVWDFVCSRIEDVDFEGLRPRDYFTVPLTPGTNTITQTSVDMMLGGFDHYYNCADDSGILDHHILCVPKAPINMSGSSFATNTSYIMWNSSATNQGNSTTKAPYKISRLHDWEINEYLNRLPSSLKSKLLNFRCLCEERYSGSGNLTASTGWSWQDLGKIFSLSEMEVYGCCVWGTPGYSQGFDSQLPIFRETKDRIAGGRVTWWLRSVSGSSASNVCNVTSNGYADYFSATTTWVRPLPCFLLGA